MHSCTYLSHHFCSIVPQEVFSDLHLRYVSPHNGLALDGWLCSLNDVHKHDKIFNILNWTHVVVS